MYMYRNKTAELVNQWAAFEEIHPEADIEDFCRYYLVHQREAKEKRELFDGAIPPYPDVAISKVIDRIAKLQMIYVNIVMEGARISNFEEFALLNAIAVLKSPKKTEAIYHTLNELSTGLHLLANLKQLGLITEHDDADDKRSKRLNLTVKGGKVLQECRQRLMLVPKMLYMEMQAQDMEVCVQLLKNVEIRFSGLWQQHKGRPFGEVYESVTGKKMEDNRRPVKK
jgi:DNA-binding MarR family transcriptional regulator